MLSTIRVIDINQGAITIEVPYWVRWMATDACGSLWFYGRKPLIALEHAAWVESKGCAQFGAYIRPPKDYKQELYTWR